MKIGVGILLMLVVMASTLIWVGLMGGGTSGGNDRPASDGPGGGEPQSTGPQLPPSLKPKVSLRKVTYGGTVFVVVPTGSYTMGSPPEEIQRDPRTEGQFERSINSAFALAEHETTVAEYGRLMDPSAAVRESDRNKPKSNVTWDQAVEYCKRLGAQNPGKRFRLPSEVEWEYACRAGTTGMYGAWRGELDDLVVAYHKNAKDSRPLERRAESCFHFNDSFGPKVVKKYDSNAWGLYDMHGNVWEWCGESDVSRVPGRSLKDRPIRGGSWASPTCFDCRSAKRAWQARDRGKESIGFRVLLENP